MTVNNASVNDQINMTNYPEMFYGHCLKRVAHLTVALRARAPSTSIMIAKYNYSDVYCRVAHSPEATAQSIVVFEGIAFATLQLTFGGSPNLPGFCAFSEMVADLANKIHMCNTTWDHTVLFSPSQPTPPISKRLDPAVSFSPAAQLVVDIPAPYNSGVDCFINDLINVFLDNGDNWRRKAQIVPLAIHIQMVPGWQFDTRQLEISLLHDKFTAWHNDALALIHSCVSSVGSLESPIGKLNHVSYVIPLARHFISCLRARVDRGKGKRHQLQLHKSEVDDLVLWKAFLHSANQGISLNNLVLRTPSRTCWSDSCPLGMGGFALESGKVWRL